MWKPIYQPEPWPQFVKRKDIKSLPLMEQRKKFLQEQILFENYLSTLNTLNTVSPSVSSAASGGGGPAPGGGGDSGGADIIFKINTALNADPEYWKTGSAFTQTKETVHMYLQADLAQFWYNLGTPPGMTIDWGDGTVEENIVAYNTWTGGFGGTPNGLLGNGTFPLQTHTHSYASPGEYTISITNPNAYDIKLAWLPITDLIKYNPANITSYEGLFQLSQADSNVASQIASWDTSGATELLYTFANLNNLSDNFGNINYFTSSWNPDVSGWDVSNVTTMNRTFMGMQHLNQDLSSWNISSMTSMIGSFWGCSRLVSGGRVDQWDMSSVTSNGLQELFQEAMRDSTAVGSMPHVGGWDLSNGITSLSKLFSGSGFSHTAVGETLIGWSSGSISDNVNASQTFASTWDGAAFTNPSFDTGISFGAEVSASYSYLVNTRGWTITDITFT